MIRYYGFYSNKKRGARNKKDVGELPQKSKKKSSLTWAMLIKMIYEVEPLTCPVCQSEMKIISLIDGKKQPNVVEKILRHCELWKDTPSRSPPQKEKTYLVEPEESTYDYDFFVTVCV